MDRKQFVFVTTLFVDNSLWATYNLILFLLLFFERVLILFLYLFGFGGFYSSSLCYCFFLVKGKI